MHRPHRQRKGRLNTTTWIDATTIRKEADIVEPDRPIRLGVEAWALAVAKRRGLTVPTVYSSGYTEDGREVLYLERIEGVTLDRVSDYRIRAQAFFDVGRQLTTLTNVSPTFGWIDINSGQGTHASWRQFLIDYVERHVAILVQSNLLAADFGQQLLDVTKTLDGQPAQASLVHRDIKPGNIILRPDGGATLLDWENAFLGDSLYDVALYEVREGQSHISSELLRGYGIEAVARPERYRLYGAIALLGITDFLREYDDYAENQAVRLGEIIEQLQPISE